MSGRSPLKTGCALAAVACVTGRELNEVKAVFDRVRVGQLFCVSYLVACRYFDEIPEPLKNGIARYERRKDALCSGYGLCEGSGHDTDTVLQVLGLFFASSSEPFVVHDLLEVKHSKALSDKWLVCDNDELSIELPSTLSMRSVPNLKKAVTEKKGELWEGVDGYRAGSLLSICKRRLRKRKKKDEEPFNHHFIVKLKNGYLMDPDKPRRTTADNLREQGWWPYEVLEPSEEVAPAR